MSWNVRPAHLAGAAAIAVAAIVATRAVWPASAASSTLTPSSNVDVNCEPGQRALVRQTVVRGEPRVAIQCASAATVQSAADGGELVRPTPALAPPEPQLVRASYVVPADAAPRRVTRPAASTTRPATAARAAGQQRSWEKTLLVIGGSAGAGAGIGAIVGGKKGALIGAAIGGGGAGLLEAIKR